MTLPLAFFLPPAGALLLHLASQDVPRPNPEVLERQEEARALAAPLQGPPALRAPGALLSIVSGYRPVDVQANDPAYDGFPSPSHTEPSIAGQGDAAVTAFNDGGADSASPNPATTSNADGFSISRDGGATYRDQGKRPASGGHTSYLGDNVIAAGPDGDFYYLSDAGQSGGSYNSMGVSRSTDGGVTWSPTANATTGVSRRYSDGFFDKGWIAVDTSPAATRGNVYVSWSEFSFGSRAADLYVSRSTNRGQTWSARRIDSFPHPVAVTYIQVAPNGWVYLGEQDEGTIVNGQLTGTNYVRVSTDGGASWSGLRTVGTYRAVGDPIALQVCGSPTFFGGLVRYLNGPIEADSSLRLAADASDPTGRTVYVMTQAIPDRPHDASDVVLWRSTDAGLSWTPPIRVNDDDTALDQFMPDLWSAPDGTLGVLWMDRRNDPTNWRMEAYMALSRDGGRTFSCSFPVSSASFVPAGRCQMSDYNGVHADARRFLVAWGDARQADPQAQLTQAIYAAALPLEGPGPILSLASTAPDPGAPDRIRLTLRNDGLRPATSLVARVTVEGTPLASFPVPDVPACHGTAEVTFALPAGLTGPFARGSVDLEGPEGHVTLPFSVPLPNGEGVGLLLADDFEAPGGDFTPAAGSLWHETSGCAALVPGHGGVRVSYFGFDGSCDYNAVLGGTAQRVFGSLTSREVELPPGAAVLRFREWVGLPAGWTSDAANLQVSTDGGASFENAWGYGRMSRFVRDPALPRNGQDGRPSWHDVEVDLSPYAGQSVVVRFFVNVVGKTLPGYAVDDVRLVSLAKAAGISGLGTCGRPLAIALEGPLTLPLAAEASAGADAPCGGGTAHPLWLTLTPKASGRLRLTSADLAGRVSVLEQPACDGTPSPSASTCFAPGSDASLDISVVAGRPLTLLVEAGAEAPAARFTLTLHPLAETARRLVPIVLDVPGSGTRYTTELALTNRGAAPVTATLAYTAALGRRLGSGSVVETLPPGQLLIPDVLARLRQKGLPVPAGAPGDQQGGTLLVTFEGAGDAEVAATARTVSPTQAPLPAGLATVAYAGERPDASSERVIVFGLRSGQRDRGKLAIYSTGDEPVAVKVTMVSGGGDGRSAIYREAEELPPWGFLQYEDIHAETGIANGWAVVERVSASGRFGAYGVVNDNVTNDGSFIAATPSGAAMKAPGSAGGAATAAAGATELVVPVVVETDRFGSELVLANTGGTEARLTLDYLESLSPVGAGGGSAAYTLPSATQLIAPSAFDLLRQLGVPVGAKGAAPYAGRLRIAVEGGAVLAGARTLASGGNGATPPPAPSGFGLFAQAVARGDLAVDEAWLYGLRTDTGARTNVAVVHAGGAADGTLRLELTPFDGDNGGAAGEPLVVTLAPGAWSQPVGWLSSTGIANAWVRVRRLDGSAPFLAYAVVNDGSDPGRGTDDGAFVTMVTAPERDAGYRTPGCLGLD